MDEYVRDFLNAHVNAFTSFAPSITGSTTSPTYGTGATRDGKVGMIGNMCVGWSRLIMGTGATAGSGSYYFSLPAQAVVSPDYDASYPVASGLFFDSSAATVYVGNLYVTQALIDVDAINGRYLAYFRSHNATTFQTAASPVAPAVSDAWYLHYHYAVDRNVYG